MRKLLYLATALIALTGMAACGGATDKLRKQVDSLEAMNAQNQSIMEQMTSFVSTLSEGLDTIAKQEGRLFFSNKGPEGTLVDKEQLKKNLESFANTLMEQREKIKKMAEILEAKGVDMKKLETLIDYLNRQIEEKDQMITQLKNDLNQKNVNIAQLRGKVSSLNQDNQTLNKKLQEQEKLLSSAKIGKGFVVMGSKKILKENGILKGSKINYDDLPHELFTEVDTRTFGGMEIPAGKPKVLSTMPSSSYEIVRTSKDASEIHILDPEAFWSNTKYLIIQTN
ncbi:Cbp1 family collagen-binding glycoprotein adhesin [Bacteroides heparinolyticus]|uniref:Cbp1 family collagen-binding glycoprotein adhesin n=1 Tax=Prevotella heparinolytica TaxID=28113 RepID=UPI003FA066C8